MAIPLVSVLSVVVLIFIFDRSSLLGLALNDRLLTSLLILNLVFVPYHLFAVIDAYMQARWVRQSERRAPSPMRKWAATLGIVAVVTGTIAFHGAVQAVGSDWQHSLYCLTAITPCFADTGPDTTMPSDDPGGGQVDVTDTDSPAPSGPMASPSPLTTFDLSTLPSFETTDVARNWAQDNQLNVLLIGADFGPQRSGLRPDTMIVLHVDLPTHRAVMIGVGRNTICVPLPSDIAQHYAKPNNGCPA